ncbi:MAG: hemerythrin domain-containing protein [Terriglobia bacterium]|nr:hemerythrin domain-containing protein [Terriglobia bacterium]
MCTDSKKLPEDWNGRSLTSLIGHIVETHHAFCRREVARLALLFREVIDKHGKIHPELKQIHDLFFQMSRDLTMHLLKEEQTLFPYIARFEEEGAKDTPMSWPPFGTVENPIRMMVLEHVKTDDEIKQIRELSNDYTPPVDACDRYISLYDGLAAFDRDMQRHIHFEDNLLFPRAVAMEEEACARQKTAGG